jgi:hypothetical protein
MGVPIPPTGSKRSPKLANPCPNLAHLRQPTCLFVDRFLAHRLGRECHPIGVREHLSYDNFLAKAPLLRSEGLHVDLLADFCTHSVIAMTLADKSLSHRWIALPCW